MENHCQRSPLKAAEFCEIDFGVIVVRIQLAS